jgi:PEP-CTERM motif
VWTGNPQVTYGNAEYFIGSNGSWSPSGEFSWIATNDGSGSITVNLGGNFGLIGGFMNYGPGFGADATITALAADGVTVLESYDLVTSAPISTPDGTNAGAFRGISRPQDDIHYFELSGNFILAHTLEIGQAAAPVPEPGTLALLGFGLAAFGLLRRRKI